jgi:bla regulator protein blaR1
LAASGRRKDGLEVASVRPAKPDTFTPPTFFLDLGDAKPPGGRFSGSYPLASYILFAYKLQAFKFGEIGTQLPKWANDIYAIEAKADGNPTKDQMRLMMQSLLADRFKLRAHFETKEVPVLALTLVKPGKLGPRLLPHAEGPSCPDSFEMTNPFTVPPSKPGDVFPPQCGTPALFQATTDGARIGSRNTTMGLLAQDIFGYGSQQGELDKPVVDQTGLQGRFDFILDLPAGTIPPIPKLTDPNPPGPDKPLTDPKGTPFLNAVREQLGLKLVSTKGAIGRLIIDHVERPTEN